MDEPEAYRGDDRSGGLPASRPPRPASPGHRVGRVEGSLTRVEGQGSGVPGETVTAFRLVDGTGVPVEVELRGRSVVGTVRDGDWVEVPDKVGRSGRLEPWRLHNLTTRSDVTARGSRRRPAARVVLVVVLVAFVVVAVIILLGVLDVLSGTVTDSPF